MVKRKKLGIEDIARKLNVSVTTVSFILNGKAEEMRISTKLTQKVLKLVDKLSFVPNHLAKSLRTGRTNIIALIVEDISNPFFASVARLIEENAYKKGFRIIYCSSENDTDKTRELIKVFRERQVDAYIITPTTGIEKDIESLLKENLSIVLFDRNFPDIPVNYVGVDNLNSTYNGVKHLIAQGYKNIGFVTLKSNQTQMHERLQGYKKAIKEYKLKSYIKRIPFHDKAVNYVEQISAFINKKESLDSIFFATNYLGISGLEALGKLNKKIPADIGIVSFDDHDLFRLYSPSITVVAQPIEKLSEQIINILLDDIDHNGKMIKQTKVLTASLIIRNSSLKK